MSGKRCFTAERHEFDYLQLSNPTFDEHLTKTLVGVFLFAFVEFPPIRTNPELSWEFSVFSM